MTESATRADELTPAWHEALTRDEIQELLELRDARAWLSLAVNWGIVFACFALVARYPNPLTILFSIFAIGARQLGLAVLMHDAAHRVLLRKKSWNDWVGNWLCAYPVWSNTEGYRRYHLRHHAKTGTLEDPDLALAAPFPVTRDSLRRKFWRDLSGRTGWKFARASWQRTRHAEDEEGRRAFRGFLVTNGALLLGLALLGHPGLYLLWVAAWLTTNTLVTRIRSIAEHAMTPRAEDPLGNTRTTVARWWERLFLAPNRVNYHLEHHLLMTVPHYRLPAMHRLLEQRGLLAGACVERGYAAVLRRAASGEGDTPAPKDVLPPRVPPF